MSFKTYHSTVGIRANNAESLDEIRSYLPPGWKPSSAVVVDRLYSFLWARGAGRPGLRRFHTAYSGMQNLARSQDPQDLFEAFESDLSVHIAQTSADRCFVHAGVVGWRGRAIVVPGPSHSGKTTLISEFLRHGATYYSDEFAVFDRRGWVHPFARCLGVRPSEHTRQHRIAPSEFGSARGEAPMPVALVLVTTYRGSASWNPTEITPAQGALALLANALSARARPAGAISTLEKAVRHARILRGKRGEARETVDRLLQQCHWNSIEAARWMEVG